ncbi:MAG: hypothetical protein ACI9VM_000493 [Candidatus Azotimanducaceae bacterium]|jgi:hypothetical protein
MPETKKEEESRETSATGSNADEQQPSIPLEGTSGTEPKVEELKSITLQEHLEQMEKESISFPSAGVVPTIVPEVRDSATAATKTEEKPEEAMKTEPVVTMATSVSTPEEKPVEKEVEKIAETPKSEPEPRVVHKQEPAPQKTATPEPATTVMEEKEPEERSNKTMVAFGSGLLVGGLLVSFLL